MTAETQGDGTAGTLTFDIQAEQNGAEQLTVTVTNTGVGPAVETLTLFVNAGCDVPIFTDIVDPSTPADKAIPAVILPSGLYLA